MARLISLCIFASVLSGCGMCGNDVMQTVASSSGSPNAVVFQRDCGATTGFSTQVSVVPAIRSLPNEGGNALIIAGRMPLHVQWQSASTLQISGLGQAKIYKQETHVMGVTIRYSK